MANWRNCPILYILYLFPNKVYRGSTFMCSLMVFRCLTEYFFYCQLSCLYMAIEKDISIFLHNFVANPATQTTAGKVPLWPDDLPRIIGNKILQFSSVFHCSPLSFRDTHLLHLLSFGGGLGWIGSVYKIFEASDTLWIKH